MQHLDIRPEVAAALAERRPVVALESTLIAQGLPWPLNLETSRAAEGAVRSAGCVPATIAVWRGRPTVGLSDAELADLARADGVLKAGRRDLAAAVTTASTAATTVSATMFLAHLAGIRVFATGGIGGVHPRPLTPFPSPLGGEGEGVRGDVSADLVELSRTPVAVVCAGAKSILDIPATLEHLETLGVPVIGYRTAEFPAFYTRTSGEGVSVRLDSPAEVARFLTTHWELQGAGVVVAQPASATFALTNEELASALAHAEANAAAAGVRGKDLTPYLLRQLAELTGGKTLQANHALLIENARLAAEIAAALVVTACTW